jgi:uncharacterized GH25 family protein
MKIWHREKGKTINQEMSTDENGEISFLTEPSGEWMLSCVKMVRLENDPKATWQSYWGSCTWGYE